jgi:hypothetical protein
MGKESKHLGRLKNGPGRPFLFLLGGEKIPVRPDPSIHLFAQALGTKGSQRNNFRISFQSKPVLSQVEGPVLSQVEGPVLSQVEGPVLSQVEGPVLSQVEGDTNIN